MCYFSYYGHGKQYPLNQCLSESVKIYAIHILWKQRLVM